MWILLLFQGFMVLMIGKCAGAGGGLGDDADSQGDDSFDCTLGLLKCDSYRISLSERIFSEFLIEGPTELRRKCRSIEPFLECMEDATWRCEQTDTTPADEAIIKSGEFLRQLCMDHNGLKKNFLSSTACINKHYAGTYLNCKPDKIYKNITAFYPSVKASCQYQKALLECRRNSIDKQCGEEVGDFYTQIMTLELNLDYLCIDEISTRAPHKFTFDVIDVFISILIDLIRPVLHVMSDLSSVKSRDPLVPELEKIASQLWAPPKEKSTETYGCDGTCSRARQEKSEPEMNFTNLRRHGNLPPKVTEKMKEEFDNFYAKMEMELLTAMKSYKAVLTEFPQSFSARQERSTSDVDICDEEECGHQRSDSSYKKPETFHYKPTGTDAQDINTSTETYGDDGTCSRTKQEKSKPEMNFTNLRRYGNLPPKVAKKIKEELKVNFNAKMEMELLIALKSYKAALSEFAQSFSATHERSISDADTCGEAECRYRRSDSSYKKPETFHYKPTGTDAQDTSTLLNNLETKVGSKFVKKQRNRIPKVEDVVKFSESGESKEEREMKINYVLIGKAYLPLEINYSDGDQDYSHYEDVKIFDKKFLLTPSTQTIPSMNSEDVVESTKVLISDVEGIEECDQKQD